MREITVKGYTRKGKSGKTFTVKSYSRKVGRKGQVSPKEEYSVPMTNPRSLEIQRRIREKYAPKMTKEELADWDISAREGNRKNISIGRALQLEESRKKASPSNKQTKVNAPLSKKGSEQIFARVEDKIANFVEKYGGTYKKMVK